jgi:hypothetical protein
MANFCHNATHVYIADGIKYISTAILLGHSSYMQNSDIQSLRFPSTLQTIGKETFTAMPQKVRYLVIPKSVKYVGERAIGKQCLNYKLALSVYFEHETLEEINHLTLIKPWCSGLYFKDWNSCVLVKVKNEAMKINYLPRILIILILNIRLVSRILRVSLQLMMELATGTLDKIILIKAFSSVHLN